jgi:hypothetical protein
MLIPGLLDWYLSKKAWKGQLSSEPVDLARRRDNLHSALPGDFGGHGRFDREARESSLQARMRANPRMLAWLGAASLMLLTLGIARRRQAPNRLLIRQAGVAPAATACRAGRRR